MKKECLLWMIVVASPRKMPRREAVHALFRGGRYLGTPLDLPPEYPGSSAANVTLAIEAAARLPAGRVDRAAAPRHHGRRQ